MSIPVTRYLRNKIIGDPASQELVYLKRVAGHTRTMTEKDVAEETEAIGGMSVEDVSHVMRSFARAMKKILVRGDKVKIPNLGTFYTTFNCDGVEDEKDCTVRNIRKVNIRFAVDNTLRLVNDSTASTRGAANNVEFYIKSGSEALNTGDTGGGDDDDDIVDPGT